MNSLSTFGLFVLLVAAFVDAYEREHRVEITAKRIASIKGLLQSGDTAGLREVVAKTVAIGQKDSDARTSAVSTAIALWFNEIKELERTTGAYNQALLAYEKKRADAGWSYGRNPPFGQFISDADLASSFARLEVRRKLVAELSSSLAANADFFGDIGAGASEVRFRASLAVLKEQARVGKWASVRGTAEDCLKQKPEGLDELRKILTQALIDTPEGTLYDGGGGSWFAVMAFVESVPDGRFFDEKAIAAHCRRRIEWESPMTVEVMPERSPTGNGFQRLKELASAVSAAH